MANTFTNTQDLNSATTEYQNNKIGLPIFALALALAPILFFLLMSLSWNSQIWLWILSWIPPWTQVTLLTALLTLPLLPIFSAILGFILLAFDSEKAPIGKTRRIFATTAIAISLFYLVSFFILMIFF